MRKLVDVFVLDRLRATYPVTLEEPATPEDHDFIDYIRMRMPRTYTEDEIAAARFVVRDA